MSLSNILEQNNPVYPQSWTAIHVASVKTKSIISQNTITTNSLSANSIEIKDKLIIDGNVVTTSKKNSFMKLMSVDNKGVIYDEELLIKFNTFPTTSYEYITINESFEHTPTETIIKKSGEYFLNIQINNIYNGDCNIRSYLFEIKLLKNYGCENMENIKSIRSTMPISSHENQHVISHIISGNYLFNENDKLSLLIVNKNKNEICLELIEEYSSISWSMTQI